MKITQFSPNVYGIYKPAGCTPLQALFELKNEKSELRALPLTYAGRLDPMAEGLLLVLAGEAVHEKDKFLSVDKEYKVTALLGVQTDSFDLLGIPSLSSPPLTPPWSKFAKASSDPRKGGGQELQTLLQSYVGETILPLPIYSSPPYKGKPLHAWAQEKNIHSDETPKRQTSIHSITEITTGRMTAVELLNYITATIPNIDGSFRQDETINAWHDLLRHTQGEDLLTTSFTVSCSSGTYIRSLVNEIGKKLGTGACVYTLVRTKVGQHTM